MKVILAVEETTQALGIETGLCYRSKEDMEHFVKTTKGNSVYMGYKTWLSLPNKPLKGRISYVVVSEGRKVPDLLQKAVDAEEVRLIYLQEFLKNFKTLKGFLIGGKMLYEKTFPLWTEAYITFFERKPDVRPTVFLDGIDLKTREPRLLAKRYIDKHNTRVEYIDYRGV